MTSGRGVDLLLNDRLDFRRLQAGATMATPLLEAATAASAAAAENVWVMLFRATRTGFRD